MKKKIIWVLVSCLMVLSLVLASCAPAAPPEQKPAPPVTEKPATPEEKPATPKEEAKGPEMVKVRLQKTDGTWVEKMVEKPRYGGELTLISSSPLGFDPNFATHTVHCYSLLITNETLLVGDWAKSAAGTGEASWLYYIFPRLDCLKGSLAESWEVPDSQTIIFHIRKGVHFHNKPPTNGREMTADDVVFSFQRQWEAPTTVLVPFDNYMESIAAPDKWTVVFKTKPGMAGSVFESVTMGSGHVLPRDAVEQYGNLSDWRNSCGTGPYMLVDYVNGSSLTFKRNPNYWGKDPIHPENTLPYLDGMKWVNIPDASTQLAALRTAKIDFIGGITEASTVSWEQANSLMKTNPELKYLSYPLGAGEAMYMRQDKPGLPFHDVRVRQALSMAIDRQSIVDLYYGGNAVAFAWPVMPIPEYADIFIPLEELPENIREIYEYHPDKAKQLLAEAGYPDGFKTKIVCLNTNVDMLSIIKDYWAKVDIDLTLDVREYAVQRSITLGGKTEEMCTGTVVPTSALGFSRFKVGSITNQSMINDARINEAIATCDAAAIVDETKRRQTFKDILPYMLEQCYVLAFPTPKVYHFWQPWVKSFNGEMVVGQWGVNRNFVDYIWVDQELKREMTGR